MRIYEEFTRCSCGEAYLEKKELVCASYKGNGEQLREIPSLTKVIYRCVSCHKVLDNR